MFWLSAKEPRTMMSSLLVLVVMVMYLVVQSSVLADQDIQPHCQEKCSDEVECTVLIKSHCSHDITNEKSVASKVTNLNASESRDKDFKYINLDWTPPDDGSFRDLKAFSIHVGFFSHDHKSPGDRGSQCYKINITDPAWIEKYSITSVKFFLRCIRLALSDFMTVTVTVYSLPINVQRPKMVTAKIMSLAIKWDPSIQRWVDHQNNVHIRIRKPHRNAMFYNLSLFEFQHHSRVFGRVFPAQHIRMKNEEDSMTVADDKHFPHFVIKNLPINATYYLTLFPMFANKTNIPEVNIKTRPLTLNFTQQTQHESPGVSRVAESKSEDGLSGPLVTIILVIILVLFVFVGLITWKIFCQSAPLPPWLACKFLVPPLSNNLTDRPKILPIYCDENEDFVRAVQSHVTLLQRYVNVLPVLDRVETQSNWCPWLHHNRMLGNSDFKVTDVIIYLSPSLGQLTSWQQGYSLSRLDQFCHQTLQSLCHHQQQRQNGSMTIHVVTFDCFQSSELQCMTSLQSILSLAENGSNLHEGVPPIPLKLASFRQNSWKLENLEQLLFRLCQVREFPLELPPGIQGWQESPEAKQVEYCLAHFGTPSPTTDNNNRRSDDGNQSVASSNCNDGGVQLESQDVIRQSPAIEGGMGVVIPPRDGAARRSSLSTNSNEHSCEENEVEKCVVDVVETSKSCEDFYRGNNGNRGNNDNRSNNGYHDGNSYSAKYPHDEDDESECVSGESSGFYSTVRGVYYTKLPSISSSCPDKYSGSNSNIDSAFTYSQGEIENVPPPPYPGQYTDQHQYSHRKQQQQNHQNHHQYQHHLHTNDDHYNHQPSNIDTDSDNDSGSIVNTRWWIQQDDVMPRNCNTCIRPPPSLSLSYSDSGCANITANPASLSRENSNDPAINEHMSISLESDSLLTKDQQHQNKSFNIVSNDRKHSHKNTSNPTKAIISPSRLVYALGSESLTDLISRQNDTSGWNSSCI